MLLLRAGISLIIAVLCNCTELKFPPNLKFGSATAAYQVEGAWNVSDKTESIWDTFVHMNPSPILNSDTGDIACDSYHLWERDIAIAAEMNLDFYRFSLSWTRILPDGFSNRVSEDGVRYYNNLIDGLLAKGIEPVVTIYHWDLPQRLQNLGGWTNPLIVDWFSDFARVVFANFGDRVKTWLTINEPLVICDVAYNTGVFAIPFRDNDVFQFLCNKNILLAHAKAWRIYDEEYRPLYHGKVSIGNHLIWFEPVSEEDADLAELANQYNIGRYSHPIYSKEGGWPPAIEQLIAKNSAVEGYPRSRLPAFTQEEIELIKGTYDFFGFNHYIARKIRKLLPGEVSKSWPLFLATDLPDNAIEISENWIPSNSDWLYFHRESIRLVLSWLKNSYGDLEYFIAETGISTKNGLDDEERVTHLREQLSQVLLSIHEDKVNVVGFTYWSLIDNFEWANGYYERFGLYEVNFDDPARTRTARNSAKLYGKIIKNRALEGYN